MNIFLIVVTLASLFVYNLVQSFVLLLTPRRFRRKKEITGQNVLITGAGNGLGRQIAIEFSKHSTCLILLDIDKKALEETARLVDVSSRVYIYECDVTNRKMVYAVAENIKDDVGDIDILVNNAGTVSGKNFMDLPDEKIVKTMEVNAISHFWTCKSFLPSMMAKNSGHIVTIASLAGYSGCPGLTDYCASKYAIIGFYETLEMELRVKNLDGVKITIVSPTIIDTDLFIGARNYLDKLLSPKYVAEKIVEAVQEEKEAIFLPQYYSYTFIFKSMAPRWLWIITCRLTRYLNVMETFKGRPSSEETSILT